MASSSRDRYVPHPRRIAIAGQLRAEGLMGARQPRERSDEMLETLVFFEAPDTNQERIAGRKTHPFAYLMPSALIHSPIDFSRSTAFGTTLTFCSSTFRCLRTVGTSGSIGGDNPIGRVCARIHGLSERRIPQVLERAKAWAGRSNFRGPAD